MESLFVFIFFFSFFLVMVSTYLIYNSAILLSRLGTTAREMRCDIHTFSGIRCDMVFILNK